MRHLSRNCITLAGALLIALGWPPAAHASPQSFVDQGCYNCHGPYLRGEAPSIESLSARLSKYKGDPAAEQRFVEKFRVGEAFEHIDPHERVSAESAKLLIHWLVEGAK